MGNLPGRSNLQLQAAAPPRHHGNHRAVPRRWGPGDAWDGGPGPSDGKHRDGLHHENMMKNQQHVPQQSRQKLGFNMI